MNIPNLTNSLADEIGRLDALKAQIEEKLSALKAEFKATGLDVLEGQIFTISQSKAIRQTLDTAAVKQKLGQSWFDDHSKLAEVTTVRIKAKVPNVLYVVG